MFLAKNHINLIYLHIFLHLCKNRHYILVFIANIISFAKRLSVIYAKSLIFMQINMKLLLRENTIGKTKTNKKRQGGLNKQSMMTKVIANSAGI